MSLLDEFNIDDFNNDSDYNQQIEQDLIDIDISIQNLKSYDYNSKKIISNSNLTNLKLNNDLNIFIHIFGYIFRRLDNYRKVKCAFLFWIICTNYFSFLFYKNKIDTIKYLTYHKDINKYENSDNSNWTSWFGKEYITRTFTRILF